jgi:hypothetical protein
MQVPYDDFYELPHVRGELSIAVKVGRVVLSVLHMEGRD